MYNPRSKKAILAKYSLKSTESAEGYLQTKTHSAKESIGDPQVENRAKASLRAYVLSQVFATINDAKLFFNADPARAYDELLALIQSPEIRQPVEDELTKQKEREAELRAFYSSTESWEEHKAYQRCYEALKAVKEAEAELETARRWSEAEQKKAKAAFPTMQFDEE